MRTLLSALIVLGTLSAPMIATAAPGEAPAEKAPTKTSKTKHTTKHKTTTKHRTTTKKAKVKAEEKPAEAK